MLNKHTKRSKRYSKTNFFLLMKLSYLKAMKELAIIESSSNNAKLNSCALVFSKSKACKQPAATDLKTYLNQQYYTEPSLFFKLL